MAIVYRIYASTPSAPPGGVIDELTPVATVSALPWSWTGSPIPVGFVVSYAVRAYDTVSGLENPDISSVLTVATRPDGSDPASFPLPPTAVSAVPGPGGTARISWAASGVQRAQWPLDWRVYIGITNPSYTTPAIIVPAGPYPGRATSRFYATISGLSVGLSYVVAVRGHVAAGDGPAGSLATVSVPGSTPVAVTSLVATLGARSGR